MTLVPGDFFVVSTFSSVYTSVLLRKKYKNQLTCPVKLRFIRNYLDGINGMTTDLGQLRYINSNYK